MSNVLHRGSVNSGAFALGYLSKIQSKRSFGCVSCVTRRSANLNRTSLVFPSTYLLQKRFLNGVHKDETQSNTSRGEDEDKHKKSGSSSSSHQYYHRQSYENKRSRYDEEKTRYNKSRENRVAENASMMNHYQRLNVQPDSDLSTIKSAYYSLSKVYHPDIVGITDQNAAENFRLITESYTTLSDINARAEYDRSLASSKTSRDMYMHPHGDFNPIFRTRDADVIFKSKQETALQREKMLNPKKFRAGVFKSGYVSQENTQEKIDSLRRRLEDLKKIQARSHGKKDGSDFYQMHLYDTIVRRQSDLATHEKIKSSYHQTESEPVSFAITTCVGILLIVFIAGINLIMDIDLARDLDNKLETALNEKDKVNSSKIR